MVKVLVVKTKSRIDGMKKIFQYYKETFQAFENKTIIIKPNFNTADPPPASTDITIIRELISHLISVGVKKVIVMERSGPANTYQTMVTKGLYILQEELGNFDIIDLSQPQTHWIPYNSDDLHWKKGFLYPKLLETADAIITLPCLKTHQFGGHFTLSLKISVGLVPRDGYSYMSELHSSPHIRKMIAEINQIYSPSLIILDGVDAFVTGGPAKGTLKNAQVMLASTDRIAVDSIGVAILRELGTTSEVSKGSILDQEQISRAIELSLGIKSLEEIDLVGYDELSQNYTEKIKKWLN